jgi:hypothetical protein
MGQIRRRRPAISTLITNSECSSRPEKSFSGKILKKLDQTDQPTLCFSMAVLDREQTSASLNAVRGNQRYLDTNNCGVQKVRNLQQAGSLVEDLLLQGLLASASCHIERKQLGLRLRARLVAVQMALLGERRSTLPEIAEQVGTSTRTLNLQFGVKDALFAFPPPELVPVLFDCWVSAEDSSDLNNGLVWAFRELDRNPLTRSLLMGLARLHIDQPKLFLTDGGMGASRSISLGTIDSSEPGWPKAHS